MGDPSRAQLRKLIFKFYQENDPVILQQGFDVNGLVEFTLDNGIDSLNTMLERKYGKIIDVEEDVGNARDVFTRMSVGLTISTQIIAKEQEYRTKLYNFFQKHDPPMVGDSRAAQFEKFVKFAMLNGIPKLSEKLKQKYGEGISDNGEGANVVVDVNNADMQFGNSGLNPFKLEVDRLRDDLEKFFTDMEDEQQLEMLDEMTDWACQIGIEEFDSKMEQMYGMTLNAFLKDSGRQGHENQGTEQDSGNRVAQPSAHNENSYDINDAASEYEEVEEEYQVGEREFDEMTDSEIIAELTEFYQQHDPDNLEKMDQVLGLCRTLGRNDLNDKLSAIYGEPLNPIPVKKVRMVKRKIERPIVPQNSYPPGLNVREDDEESGWGNTNNQPPPEEEDSYNFQPPPIPNRRLPPPPMGTTGSLQGDLANAIKRPRQNVEQAMNRQNQQAMYEEESKPKLAPWQLRQKNMIERIRGGVAKVSDGRGNTFEVNILIDVCKNYRLDVSSGICVCGFAKKDHFYSRTAAR